jgi:sugar (pentulose or hexulose) kinase
MDLTLDLTLVIDIGKSNAKLLLLDAAGTVVERHSRANASVTSPLGYPALDVHGLQAWMQATLRASANAPRCGHVIASTHGAALVALAQDALAWEPLD